MAVPLDMPPGRSHRSERRRTLAISNSRVVAALAALLKKLRYAFLASSAIALKSVASKARQRRQRGVHILECADVHDPGRILEKRIRRYLRPVHAALIRRRNEAGVCCDYVLNCADRGT